MRDVSRLSLAVLVTCALATSVSAAASGVPFTMNLFIGSIGPQVVQLQQILNADPATRVVNSGPGSPGNETSYFGPLTKAAVIRYQDKYAAQILVPNNLSAGTGFVGSSTRAVLNTLGNPVATASDVAASSTALAASTTPATQTPATTGASGTTIGATSTNPNLEKLDYVLNAIRTRGQQQGMSASNISIVVKSVQDVMATTTDLTAEFLKTANIQISGTSPLSVQPPLPQDIVTKVLVALGLMQVAHAVVPIPFGGTLAAAVPCTCSPGVWLLVIAVPLPPSFPGLLDYVSGSQLFLSNTPTPHTAQSFLGFYSAGTPACWMVATPCAPVPGWGTVTPFVGSSL